MSKERELALRGAHKAKELEELMKAQALRITVVPEDAMHQIWTSERRELIDGKWYIPISEVSEILTATTETPDPLSEEWQASTFPNLNIGKPTPEEDSKSWLRNMVEIEPNDMELGGRVRAEYWKDRNRIPDRY